MQIVLPIEDLQPGMFVDSVHKHKSDAGVKIKSRGMVRDKAIIQKLIDKGVLELKIDFTQSDIPVPEKYQQPEPDNEPQPETETAAKKGTDGSLSTAKVVQKTKPRAHQKSNRCSKNLLWQCRNLRKTTAKFKASMVMSPRG